MTGKPLILRRYFQFSLRTLLIFVALFAAACGYLAQQAKIAWERRSLLDISSAASVAFEGPLVREFETDHHFIRFAPRGAAGVSWVRQVLGDRAVSDIALSIGTDKAERQHVAALFPEARIRAYYPPYFKAIGAHSDEAFVRFPDDDDLTSTSSSR
jgi:hypothetical protein